MHDFDQELQEAFDELDRQNQEVVAILYELAQPELDLLASLPSPYDEYAELLNNGPSAKDVAAAHRLEPDNAEALLLDAYNYALDEMADYYDHR